MTSWLPRTTATGFDSPCSRRHWLSYMLRRWHCRTTHHRMALDALPLVQSAPGQRLVANLLNHYDRYLTGSIDPDIRFRDYQNHGIHVDQDYWGGAPRVAHSWYDRLQRYLGERRYGDAAHAAGVLSHYYVDPLQPLHTKLCPRGKVIHRPLEWSIVASYDAILRDWIEQEMRVIVRLSNRPTWLGEAILHGARFAHRHYDQIIQEYDLEAAQDDPQRGINRRLRLTLAQLVGLSITGWARILERAAKEAESRRQKPLPSPRLIRACLTAGLRSPRHAWWQRLERQAQAEAMEGLFREFSRRGTLVRHLPAEVDIMERVEKVYADEKRFQQQRAARNSPERNQTSPRRAA